MTNTLGIVPAGLPRYARKLPLGHWVGWANPPTVAEQHVVECWSTLRLGFKVLSAGLIGSSAVDATELIELNEALAQYMPPRMVTVFYTSRRSEAKPR
jgi:hypothetical protein